MSFESHLHVGLSFLAYNQIREHLEFSKGCSYITYIISYKGAIDLPIQYYWHLYLQYIYTHSALNVNQADFPSCLAESIAFSVTVQLSCHYLYEITFWRRQ